MTLPVSGVLSVQAINTELQRRVRAPFDINGNLERGLAAVPTGQIKFSDFYGKTAGFPTPQVDYPNPNTITNSDTGAPVAVFASLEFRTTGDLAVDYGTPTTAYPALWFQGTYPPPGYRVLFALRTSSQLTVGALGTAWNIPNDPTWQDLTTGNRLLFLSVFSTTAVTVPTYAEATYDVYLSDGASTVVSFTVTLHAEIT
jgi:hypothetical protein